MIYCFHPKVVPGMELPDQSFTICHPICFKFYESQFENRSSLVCALLGDEFCVWNDLVVGWRRWE
jgi:hypothetical protein